MAARAVPVSTTIIQVAAFNLRRTALVIKNNGGGTAYFSNDRVDLTAQGFPLSSGEFLSFQLSDFDEPQLAIYGQALAGTVDIRVWELFGHFPPAETPGEVK
jgi:hypothetical protein